eukprot:COSAG02_NODE_44815_length_362_cov_1.958175_1_plen_82_part_10
MVRMLAPRHARRGRARPAPRGSVAMTQRRMLVALLLQLQAVGYSASRLVNVGVEHSSQKVRIEQIPTPTAADIDLAAQRGEC